MDALDLNRANLFVLNKQHLTSDSEDGDICQIVKNIGGLHATNSITPYLSLHARCSQFMREDLDVELYRERTLGKVRCVRKTIYIHTKDRIPIVWKATVGQVLKASRGFMASRGVNDETYEKLSKDILRLLRGREMTAVEIKDALKTDYDVSSVLYFMCDQGLLIRGRPLKGWRDKNHQYGLFADYFPDIQLESYDVNEAIIHLVKLYLASFGPARETDVVWWTGLGKTKVRRALKGLEDQFVEASIPEIGEDFIMLRSDRKRMQALTLPREPVINLLPSLDPYLMGYKERERYLTQENYNFVFDRTGNATSTILVDGRVIGVWDFEGGEEPLVKLFLFEKLGNHLRDEIFTKAEHLGKFISDVEVRVMECASMIPLSERTAGSIMSPLKGHTGMYSHANK